MYYDKEGNPIEMPEFIEKNEDTNYKRIGRTEFEDGSGYISTVWLGVDHRFVGKGAPLIFETMAFGHFPEWQERYATLEEAEAGHAAMVERAKAYPTIGRVVDKMIGEDFDGDDDGSRTIERGRWRFDLEDLGGHTHITVRVGTPGSRGLSGKLVMDLDEAKEFEGVLGKWLKS